MDTPTFLNSLLHLLIGNLVVELSQVLFEILRFVATRPVAAFDITIVIREGRVTIPLGAVAHPKLPPSYQDPRTLREILLYFGFCEISGSGDVHFFQSDTS